MSGVGGRGCGVGGGEGGVVGDGRVCTFGTLGVALGSRMVLVMEGEVPEQTLNLYSGSLVEFTDHRLSENSLDSLLP